MYAHKVSKYYLLKWANSNGAQSLYFYDKELGEFKENVSNADNIFGEGSYYYLRLFLDAPLNNVDGQISGSQMWMTEMIKCAFPQFFVSLDRDVFSSCKFYRLNNELLADKTYLFVYYYYSSPINRVKVIGKDGREIKQVTMRKLIEKEWNSESFRTRIESELSAFESRFKGIHDDLVSALDSSNKAELINLHNPVSELCALQQSRIPENCVSKKTIDIIVEGINERLLEQGLDYLTQHYTSSDYKDICQIQLLKAFTNFQNPNQLIDKELLKYDSIYDSYLELYKKSSFFYARATKTHKFIIGDDPIVSVEADGKQLMLAFPISPDYCLLICKGATGTVYDRILKVTNNTIDYINQRLYNSSKSGVVSFDKKYVCKERKLDSMGLYKSFEKIGFRL